VPRRVGRRPWLRADPDESGKEAQVSIHVRQNPAMDPVMSRAN
jgi:hypothetical protein